MKRKVNKTLMLVLFIVVLAACYAGYMTVYTLSHKSGEAPVISVESEMLSASVQDEESVLLTGVTAQDKEDGDITEQILVESISGFDQNNVRTVQYAVIDSDDNVARVSRQLQYSDYKLPEFEITKPLVMTSVHIMNTLASYVSASSVVDGDITAKIDVVSAVEVDGKNVVTFSVTDSCGGTSIIDLNYTLVAQENTIQIELTDYLVRIKAGSTLNAAQYIASIKGPAGSLDEKASEIKIENTVDTNTAGTYEVIYSLDYAGGFGVTKLVVIVE